MDKFIDQMMRICISVIIGGCVFIGVLGYLIINRQFNSDRNYQITVYNSDGSIQAIYYTKNYSSAGPSISFTDEYKEKITIFNFPTIIKSEAEQQIPQPPKAPPQDRTAEEEGRKAEKAGKELKDNPYEKGTRKHSQWEAGWWVSHDSFFGTS